MQSILNHTERIEQKSILTVCAWCHKARIITNDFKIIWSENYSVNRGQIISHSICPDCKEKIMASNTESLVFC